MTREEAKEFYHILQAYAEGKVIECRTKPSTMKGADTPNDWTEMKEIEFWRNIEYRIKPEPKYRPFKDAEECWDEMQKHKPFGWLINKHNHGRQIIESMGPMFTRNGIDVLIGSTWESFAYMFEQYTFADGTPFGKEE